jgi:hypothetical protein
LRGAFDVALHDQVGLVDLLDRPRFLPDRHGKAVHTDGASIEKPDDCLEDALVHFIKAVGVDVEHGKSVGGGLGGDAPSGPHQSVIAHPPQEVVRDAWRSARPFGDFQIGSLLQRASEQARASRDDRGEHLGRVVVQPTIHAETRAERITDHSRARRRPNESEWREIEPHRAGAGTLVDDDVQFEILHRRVEILLDGRGETVDFVDEQNPAALNVREQPREVAGLLDHRTTCGAHFRAHGIANDVGESGFSKPRRAAQENVLQRVIARLRRIHHHLETLDRFFLTREFLEKRRTQRNFKRGIDRLGGRGLQGGLGHGGHHAASRPPSQSRHRVVDKSRPDCSEWHSHGKIPGVTCGSHASRSGCAPR